MLFKPTMVQYIMISSKQATTTFPIEGFKTWFISSTKILRALVNLKRHYQPLYLSLESWKLFLFISKENRNLAVPTFQVELREHLGTFQYVNKVLQSGNTQSLRQCTFICSLAINTHPLAAIFGFNNAGTTHGVILSWIIPYHSKCSTWAHKISLSLRLIL